MARSWAAVFAVAALGAAPALAAERACVIPDFARQAKSVLDPYLAADQFSGAVLVARDGRPALREGLGLANRELGTPNNPDGKFRIGSITKQFTATAILQLAEQGKLSVDDPVSKYYPAAPAAWAKVTIKHLLTHTSGIPTYTAIPGFFDGPARLPHTPEQLIALTRDKPLDFEPGSKFAYDNSGYVLLGAIIEKVSGEDYADYLQAHIFGPLGMRDTGYDSASKIIPGRTSGYGPGPAGWVNADPLDMSVPFAAGGLYSTVDDLLRWDQALYADKPVGAASEQAMFTDYGHGYGFGWFIDQKWGRDRILHDGGINGFVSSFQRYPKDGVTVVVLSNLEGGAPEKIGADLAGLCLGVDVFPKVAVLPIAVLDRYAGYYASGPDVVVQIERQGDHLVALAPGQPATPIFPKSERVFFARTADGESTFQADDQGRITGYALHRGDQDLSFKRIDAAEAQAMMQATARRASAQTPAAGGEAALRRVIEELQQGRPDYGQMGDALAAATRQQLAAIAPALKAFGAVQSVTFKAVGPSGVDVYQVKFAGGTTEWRIGLSADGKITTLFFRPTP